MGRRGVPFVLSLLLIAGLLSVGAPGEKAFAQLPGGDTSGESQPYTVTAGTLETMTGPQDAEIPVVLDYDLYVPEVATAATPQPAMVVAHGFGNSKSVNEVITLAAHFARNGYVVLTSSHQGFGQSSGCIALDSVLYDGRNVASLIDILDAMPEVARDADGDPMVGMVGGSYGGGHQAGAASIDDRLDAISPGRTWNSLQYSLVPNNRVTTGLWDIDAYDQGVFKQGWSSLFFALGQTQPVMGNGGCDPVTQQMLFPGQPPCAGFLPAICPIFASLAGTGEVDDEQRALVRTSAAAAFTDDIDIPVLLTQGQSDTLFNLAEAMATFEALDARGVDVRILLNDGGHGYQPEPGEGEPYSGAFDDTEESQQAFAQTVFGQRLLGFFDQHLRGDGDLGPRVSYFRDWIDYDIESGDASDAYGSADDLPVDGTLAYVLDAEADGAGPSLRPAQLSAPDLEPASVTILNPQDGDPAAHSETPNFTGEGQPGANRPPMEVEGQHVAFTGPELEEAFESVGVGTVRVHVANANGQDAVLFAKLYDVDEAGTATLLRRLVTAVRIPADVLPGDVLIRLPGIVHRFEAGHRVRLVLATTDDSYRNATLADQITITTEGTESVLLLPASGQTLLDRVAGRNRLETAVQLSQVAFPDGAGTAVLAAAGDFPDALAAGGLAAAVGGPLLLTDQAGVADPVLRELQRLGAEEVLVIGGPAAVGSAAFTDLTAAGIDTVTRISGTGREATAAAVAAEMAARLGGVERVILARGDAFADALAAGSLSAQGNPVLLVGRDTIPQATAEAIAALDPAEVVIAGGPAVISDAVGAATGRATTRLGGATRYETAELLVEEARRAFDATGGIDVLMLASGEGFADALAAAPAAHALGGLLMTTPPDDLEPSDATRRVIGVQEPPLTLLVGGYAALGQRLDGQVGNLLGASS